MFFLGSFSYTERCIGAFETAQPAVDAPSNGFDDSCRHSVKLFETPFLIHISAADNPWNSTPAAENGGWGNDNQTLHTTPKRVISPQGRSAPVASPPLQEANDWDAVGAWEDTSAKKPSSTPSVHTPVTLTKEEKAAEMARRKEERKQVCFPNANQYFRI